MTDRYAIGAADSIGIIVPRGIAWAHYDLKQVQEEKFIEYELHEPEVAEPTDYETEELRVGDDIALTVANHATDAIGRWPDLDNFEQEVYGYVVPDHMLGKFMDTYPDKRILRQREDDG